MDQELFELVPRCECGDRDCPVPAGLPETITVALAEPDSVIIIRADGYPVATWPKGVSR